MDIMIRLMILPGITQVIFWSQFQKTKQPEYWLNIIKLIDITKYLELKFMDMISIQFACSRQKIKHLMLLHVGLMKKLLEFFNPLHVLLIISILLLIKISICFLTQLKKNKNIYLKDKIKTLQCCMKLIQKAVNKCLVWWQKFKE
jgi:hypothetical protein